MAPAETSSPSSPLPTIRSHHLQLAHHAQNACMMTSKHAMGASRPRWRQCHCCLLGLWCNACERPLILFWQAQGSRAPFLHSLELQVAATTSSHPHASPMRSVVPLPFPCRSHLKRLHSHLTPQLRLPPGSPTPTRPIQLHRHTDTRKRPRGHRCA